MRLKAIGWRLDQCTSRHYRGKGSGPGRAERLKNDPRGVPTRVARVGCQEIT
jgi:hypothetical protein